MALRPVSNLHIPEHLMLPSKDLKQRFFYVYNHGFTGSGAAFMTRLWASMYFPSVTKDPKFGTKKIRATAEKLAAIIPAGYLRVKKEMGKNPHFVVSVPIYTFSRNISQSLAFLQNTFLGGEPSSTPTAEQIRHANDFENSLPESTEGQINFTTITATRVISAMRLDAFGQEALRTCLINVTFQAKGNLVVVFANFRITKEEAQQLTTTEWQQLRDIDLYPPLLQWVQTTFGDRGMVPIASFPVSKIAFTLPASHVENARINEYGISISGNGVPLYLPKEVDKQQTIAYEDKYTQAGSREDGSFALVDINEGASAMERGTEIKTRLPANIVVSIDWLNNKFAYTNTSGMLTVQDLARFHKADISHIRNLMDDRGVTDALINSAIRMGEAAGVSESVFRPLAKDLAGIELSSVLRQQFDHAENSPFDWFKTAARAYKSVEDQDVIKISDISINGFGPFAPLARYIKNVTDAIIGNLESVYVRYSIKTVSESLPWLIMIAKYSDNITELRAKDEANRKAAIEQKIDPDWTIPSCPLLADEIGLLPHQKKVRNLLKDSPDFAIIPVQAGGGKSVLILTDILYEIKANRSEPYLILCPGHLVANYVQEIVYFTKGKLNVIPIVSVVIEQNGWARLQAIFEAAPRNTVVVCDYDVLKFRARSVCYGTTPEVVYPVVDFLRQFKFGYVAMDESHRVKNDNQRARTTQLLISDIKKKRLASGTMVHDSPSDLAVQIGMMDPTLFGTKEQFNEKYGDIVSGGRVVKWRPNAQQAVMQKIRSRVVIAGAMRKEWAALLPRKREAILVTSLTPEQQRIYDSLLEGVLKQIQEDAKSKKALKKFLQEGEDEPTPNPDTAEGEEEQENEVNEDEGEDLADLLKPYLARLEQFLIAPGSDKLVQHELSGPDLISRKTLRILARVHAHIFGGDKWYDDNGKLVTEDYGPFPGKVLIFCNQIESAEEVWRLASPQLKACGILYKAAEKTEHGARFENDPKIKWMVGVQASMNEGLNFQFCSRLIRTETVWNPGALEQGDSRINRPELKKTEVRSTIFYDTVVADKTIDITKTARLISKIIAAAKFENAENVEYAAIPDVPIIKMSFRNIRSLNTWQPISESNPGLLTYAQALSKYVNVREDDYDQYKENYIKKYGTGPVREKIPVAPNPKDAKLLKRVPYVPGLGIYKAEDLGLVRIDNYLNMSQVDTENEDEDEASINEETARKLDALKGMPVHTEFGEGIIRLAGRGKFTSVILNSGYAVKIRKTQVFLITRTETSTKDIRNQLLKMVGELPLSTPIEVPAESWKASKAAEKLQLEKQKIQEIKETKKRHEKLKAELSIELYLFIANGFLGIDYAIDENNQTAMKTLQANGFRITAPFYYSKISSALALKNQLNLWQEKGLRPDKIILEQGGREAFNELYKLIKAGKIKSHSDTYKYAKSNNVVNFFRLEHKPNNNKMQFKPYALIQDNIAYIALPAQGQAGTRTAMSAQFRKPTFRWSLADPTLSYFGTVQQIEEKLQKLEESGIQISNIKDLEPELRKLRRMSIRKLNENEGF